MGMNTQLAKITPENHSSYKIFKNLFKKYKKNTELILKGTL